MTDADDLIMTELQRRKVLSARELALIGRIGLRTVQQHLAALVAVGRVHRQGGQPCLYALDPAHFWLGIAP
jgi:hypothetical protein